jgi:hypothetical protein
MTPALVQEKIDELVRKGITITREPSPFGPVLIGECKIGERIVATHKLITNGDLARCQLSAHKLALDALNFIEATLGNVK